MIIITAVDAPIETGKSGGIVVVEVQERAVEVASPVSMVTEQAPPARGMARRVIGLAWPVIAQNLLETLVGVIDTLLVARLGAAAIAGVGTAFQVFFFLFGILSAVTVGASILVAHAVGAEDWLEARRVAKQSIIWGLLGSIPLAAGGAYWAGGLTSLFQVAPDVHTIGTTYLQISMILLPALVMSYVVAAILRGAGDTRTPLYVGIGNNIINAILAWGLIYGNLGLPALGAAGSAWAAAIGRLIGATVLLLTLFAGRGELSLRSRGDWFPRFGLIRRVLGLGVPAALEQTLISTAFTLLTIMIATLGTANLAAQRLSFNALSIAFLPGIGFSIAASTLVGQSLGAGRRSDARAAAQASAGWAGLWMTGMGILFFVFAPQIIGAFTNDAEVINLAATSLRVLACSQPLWGQIFVWAGALRGSGNTWHPLILNVIGMWLGVLASFLMIEFFDPTVPVLWAVCIPGWTIDAVGMWFLFRREKLNRLVRAGPAAVPAG